MKPGKRTGNFGLWVDSFAKDKGLSYSVFYDHGNKEIENVGEINGIYGTEVKSGNILAQVDVMVVDSMGNIKLILEIEDKSSPTPKKVLGVVFSIILCNRFSFGEKKKKQYFRITPETQLIFAGFTNPKGTKRKKLLNVIKPRMFQMTSPSDSIRIENTSFIFEKDLDTAIEVLKGAVIAVLE